VEKLRSFIYFVKRGDVYPWLISAALTVIYEFLYGTPDYSSWWGRDLARLGVAALFMGLAWMSVHEYRRDQKRHDERWGKPFDDD
jgi:hypothetical protein